MSRKKLYYSADEITNNLYTSGSLLMTELGTEYIGLYHSYITGETYTNGTWNPITSVKLIPYVQSNKTTNVYNALKQLNTKFKSIQASNPIVTVQDRNAGYITRYFLKKINEMLFIEVNEQTWKQWQTNKIDSNLYTGVTIQWAISGNIEDTYRNGSKVLGVISKNKKQIQAAEFDCPGISKKLTNPLELYTDTDFVVPRDINLG
jgi:hypothetical protein